MFASTFIIFDPVEPWSLPAVGVPALLAVAGFIAAVTVATYLIGSRGSWKRFFVMLSLRLGALAVVCLLLLRPSLAQYEDTIIPSKLLFLFDASKSMDIHDEFNGLSRWENALRLLRSDAVQALLRKLQRERRVEIIYYQAAVDVTKFDPQSKPDGKRTEMGYWFNDLRKQYGSESNLRGMLLLGDGADNGTRFNVLDEARSWRGTCPIYTIGLGSPKTTAKRRDIYVDPARLQVSPSPVYIKGKMKVRAVVHASGFENSRVAAQVFINGKEKTKKDVILDKSKDNEVELSCDAPDTPGDYKVTFKIKPLDGEISKENNEASTFVTVTKEGLSVLWVEGKKRLESIWVIRNVLRDDPRIRVYYTERPKQAKAGIHHSDWFDFKKRHYDVIVIGDISGSRFCDNDPAIFAQIQKMVKDKGTGILMMGGYETFGNSDWQNYPKFTDMLPVDLTTATGQHDGPVRVVPTLEGFDFYLMRLADDPNENRRLWEDTKLFGSFRGYTKIGKLKPGVEKPLATTETGDPILAFAPFGKGRVLVFGGDETYRAWTLNRKALKAYKRFWTRLVRWLAHQEEIASDVWVKLDTRRIPAGGGQSVGITVGVNNEKAENKKKKVHFRVRVIGPDKSKTEVITYPEDKSSDRKQRGFFLNGNAPGEYEVEVEATNQDGKSLGESARARFLVYAQDLESLRPAANHELLKQIAQASSGQFHLAGEQELVQLLDSFVQQTSPQNRPRGHIWPEWSREPETELLGDQVSTMLSSGVLVCYILFCTLICLEWYLRRQWDLV